MWWGAGLPPAPWHCQEAEGLCPARTCASMVPVTEMIPTASRCGGHALLLLLCGDFAVVVQAAEMKPKVVRERERSFKHESYGRVRPLPRLSSRARMRRCRDHCPSRWLA